MATESSSGTLAKAVGTAAREGNVAELRRLRVGEAGGEPVDATDSEYGRTALHWAADYGRLKAVQYLLERGATVDVPDNYKRTALHLAAWNGHAAVARELALHGADPRLTNGGGWTPLQWAEACGHGAAIGAAIEEGQKARAAAQVRYCCYCCYCSAALRMVTLAHTMAMQPSPFPPVTEYGLGMSLCPAKSTVSTSFSSLPLPSCAAPIVQRAREPCIAPLFLTRLPPARGYIPLCSSCLSTESASSCLAITSALCIPMAPTVIIIITFTYQQQQHSAFIIQNDIIQNVIYIVLIAHIVHIVHMFHMIFSAQSTLSALSTVLIIGTNNSRGST